mmetsp:Transcript_17876/g.54973  ORF Transcript_17876/g.54973 Transcript_17876/m.54973 type:complete len:136 (-) Transcript_17876:2287-2694(-)
MLVDRILHVELVSLCPQMDIVAVVMRNGALLVNRTTSWQRLLALTEEAAGISALCWGPDGRHLAVGHCLGKLSVFDIETGTSVKDYVSKASSIHHHHTISLMWWGKSVSSSNRADLESTKLAVSFVKSSCFTTEL